MDLKPRLRSVIIAYLCRVKSYRDEWLRVEDTVWMPSTNLSRLGCVTC